MAKLLLALNKKIEYDKKTLRKISPLFCLKLYLFLVYIGFTFKIMTILHVSVKLKI